MKRLAPALLAVALLLGAAPGARAQGAPDVQVGVESDTVGLGDTVRVEMSATSTQTMPRRARSPSGRRASAWAARATPGTP